MYMFFRSKFGRSVKIKIDVLVLALAKLSGYMGASVFCLVTAVRSFRYHRTLLLSNFFIQKNKLTEVPASPYYTLIVTAQKNAYFCDNP